MSQSTWMATTAQSENNFRQPSSNSHYEGGNNQAYRNNIPTLNMQKTNT
jgi:hypothetical protein